ncbi:MAG: Asp-tRNA(Asn)/Glu-tRNA(Gln) amidotransferase subunit GatB, partial [Candidatus Moranbacteria bacterium CG08_land_8_20_14_0_20_34_16]
FCEAGCLNVLGRKIGITRIHLEEDTGKLVHPKGADYSLVDFNRAGVSLMELVTEPDLETAEEARVFCQKLQQICRYLEISDADMEKGHMRCEVNLSLYKKGEEKLSGTKVEVKNINSFKFVEKAIAYEIERQQEILEKGEKVIQETRGWDANRNATISQRKKESAHDYRYFPEPDIPPFQFSPEYVDELKRKLPELPDKKSERFQKEYNLPEEGISILVSEKKLAEYFEEVASEIAEKINCGEFDVKIDKALKLATNYIITELRKYLADNSQEIKDIKITAENYAEFILIVASGKINSSAAQTVLAEMFQTGGDPSQIIEVKNLSQLNDTGELSKIADDVLKNNEKSVSDYRAGKENALKFLIGQIMKESRGKANPQIAEKMLKEKLA